MELLILILLGAGFLILLYLILKAVDTYSKIKNQLHPLDKDTIRPDRASSVLNYFKSFKTAFILTLKEKEIIFFSLVQVAAIVAAYYLWTLCLGWVPDEVWQAAAEDKDYNQIYDLLITAWAFLCAGFAGLFIGVCSCSIGVVHFLNKQGRQSTIITCLKVVLNNIVNVWVFHWIDAWITIRSFMGKGKKESTASYLARKALYYAWKMGTVGMTPALITGSGMISSIKDSVNMLRERPIHTISLRVGYSLVSGITFFAVFAATILGLGYFKDSIPYISEINAKSAMVFYMYAGISFSAAVSFIVVFLRPAFIISACDIYADYLASKNKEVVLDESPARLTAFFIMLIIFAAAVYGFLHYNGFQW